MTPNEVQRIVSESVREMESTRAALVRQALEGNEQRQYTDVCQNHFRQAAKERADAAKERRSLHESMIGMQGEVRQLISDTSRLVRELDDSNGDGILSQVKILVIDNDARKKLQELRDGMWRRVVGTVCAAVIVGAMGWLAVAAAMRLQAGR